MKAFICDCCKKTFYSRDTHVELKGIIGTSGGILLPERFHEKDFCNPECFWEWVEKFKPVKK